MRLTDNFALAIFNDLVILHKVIEVLLCQLLLVGASISEFELIRALFRHLMLRLKHLTCTDL